MIKWMILVSSFLTLAACGGGSSDGGGAPSPDTFVSGSFKDASVTGKTFPTDQYTHGYYGPACVDENTYFESDRVRIYGSTAFSEDDFKAMATLIEQRLDGALGKLGLTWANIKEADRPIFTAQATNYTLGEMTQDPAVFDIPEGENLYDEGDAYDIWRELSDAEQIAYVESLKDRFRQLNIEFGAPEDEGLDDFQRLDNEFVIGCLAPAMGGSTFGEGTLAGILMPPEYRQWPGSVGQIVTHEIIHFGQNNLMFEAGFGYLAPRWFTEGQSVVLSGQRIADPSEHYNYEPQDVIDFEDEYGDIGMAYEHYGLAYKYIQDHNSMQSIVAMLRQMKETLDNPVRPKLQVIGYNTEDIGDGETIEIPEYGDVSAAFQKAFDANMVDHNGDPLTIDRFRESYHDLMNAAY